MTHRIPFLALALVLVPAAGCSGTSVVGDGDSGERDGGSTFDAGPRDAAAPDVGGDRDGGPEVDTGSVGVDGSTQDDGGTSGVSCGPVTCEVGMVCCNESCGICTPPDGSCIELECVDGGMGTADAGGSLTICGGFAGAVCSRSEWCDYEDSLCGGADGTGVCRARPTGCPRIFDPVCGCDGNDYSNECVASVAGVDVASRGTCGGGGDCAPMDAAGVGFCDLFLGFAWDGRECTGLSGCSCTGTDCGALTTDLDECVRDHADCTSADATFECGTTRCTAFTEYCEIVTGGPAPGTRSYACNPLPDTCAAGGRPMCSTCFPSSGGGPSRCSDGGPGEMTVELLAP
jgi:hypothetical protein